MKPKKRSERAKDVKDLYKRIRTMPPSKRVQSVLNKEGQYWMSLLTPTQFAELFPDYYKRALPDVGLTMATSGAIIQGGQTPLMGGGGGPGTSKVQGAPGTATPVPSDGGQGGGKKFYPRGAPTAEPVPPDPLKILKKEIEDKAGVKIEPPAESKNLADMRKSLTEEINSNPEVKAKLYTLMKAEVGGQGEEAQQAFLETVFNRASQRGVSVDTIISDQKYYEPYQNGAFNRAKGNLTKEDIEKFDRSITKVTAGSNLTEGAMHNASAGVAADVNRGLYNSVPSTIKEVGGETYYGKTWEQKHRDEINKTYKQGIEAAAEEEAKNQRDKSGSVDPNDFPLKPDDKPEGMNEELTKLWETFKTPQERARFVEALGKLGSEEKRGVDVANEMAKAAPKKDGIPQGIIDDADRVEEQQIDAPGKIRNKPIDTSLKEKLQFAAEQADVKVVVGSGGQTSERDPSKYKREGGWTGSHQHDDGKAADVQLYARDKDGNFTIPLDPRNRAHDEYYAKFSKEFAAAGGMSMGSDYGDMGAKTHFGIHTFGVRGAQPDKAIVYSGRHRESFSSGAEEFKETQGKRFVEWKQKKIEEEEAKKSAKSAVPVTEEEARKKYEKQDESLADEIIKRQQEKDVSDPSDLDAIPMKPNDKMLKETVPTDQKGITSGHPNEGTGVAPKAPWDKSTTEQPGRKSAPTVIPTPAPTPPPSASSGSDFPGEPGPLKGSQQGQGIPSDNSQQAPAPKPQSSLTAPNNMAENKASVPTDHPKPEPSFDRAMKNIGGGRPGENSTTTYKT